MMKSGKYTLGYKSTLKSLRLGRAKLIILANNAPSLRWRSRGEGDGGRSFEKGRRIGGYVIWEGGKK